MVRRTLAKVDTDSIYMSLHGTNPETETGTTKTIHQICGMLC